jgi:hypothetical protein
VKEHQPGAGKNKANKALDIEYQPSMHCKAFNQLA